jgi:hypothetical protein
MRFRKKRKRIRPGTEGRNEWMRESGSLASKGYLTWAFDFSGRGEERGGEAGDFSDSQLQLRLSWLGWEEDTTPPRRSGEENEAHEEGLF